MLKIVVIGGGGRSETYSGLAKRMYGDDVLISAVADPLPARRAIFTAMETRPTAEFDHYDELLESIRSGGLERPDVAIIGTQDSLHFDPAAKAMDLGIDLLLEKPISNTLEEARALADKAKETGRRVVVCHVLRYTPFYRKVKEIIDSGALGEVITLNASEGVGAWHQTHSYVRGHWSNTSRSSPMILAKSCHDMDIMHWLAGSECQAISSFGSLTYFTEENAPDGAPERCTDGCPVGSTCPYNAELYLTTHRGWLPYVFDVERMRRKSGDGGATNEETLAWLAESPWGRCVYRCDNDAVDHQVVSMQFAGGATANFTMTAFNEGRGIEVLGTKGILQGGEFVNTETGADIIVRDHHGTVHEKINLDEGDDEYSGHYGGDAGLAATLLDQFAPGGTAASLQSSIADSLHSHEMAWAAEEARVTGTIVKPGRPK